MLAWLMTGALVQAMGGRTLTGHEAFSATATAPDGSLSAVPVVLAEGGAHYQATPAVAADWHPQGTGC